MIFGHKKGGRSLKLADRYRIGDWMPENGEVANAAHRMNRLMLCSVVQTFHLHRPLERVTDYVCTLKKIFDHKLELFVFL